MPCRASLVYDERLTGYDFGPSHPLAPIRLALTVRLATDLGIVGDDGLPVTPGFVADDTLIETVHDAEYVAAVRRIRRAGDVDLAHGLGTPDNPTFAGMHQASASVVGASVTAARQVWTGQYLHAVSIAGGLHHAMPGRASGFCIYNDVAVAITDLLAAGAERVAYVDVDVHHGDGVQEVFYDDPRVLTISLHESPRTLFPGTGYPDETGGPHAPGGAVNVALPAGTGDTAWLRAFTAVVPPLLRAFAPDVLVTQHGCDTHAADPLAHLELSVSGQRASYLALHDLAHDVCGGRWLATGGGGYAIATVVPRAWTHLLAIAAGTPLDPTPHLDGPVPPQGTGRPLDPADPVDAAVLDTVRAVFPLHGLDAEL